MSGPLDFRLESRTDLDPSFMSLGLPTTAFHDGALDDRLGFDAAFNGLPSVGIPGEAPQSALFLFKGSTFAIYDLLSDRITNGPQPLDNFFFGSLPPAFRLGIDAATWAGPGFANLAYAFRGSEYVRANKAANWTVNEGPSGINEFLTFSTPDGGFFSQDMGPSSILYGIRNAANRLHFFGRNGFYARHNLENGQMDVAPVPISQAWPLPLKFGDRVDLAFYGAGQEAEHIYFFSGSDYAQWDSRTETLLKTGALEERFPALAVLLPRPQLFLVENYALETYVAPLQVGKFIDSVPMPPRSTTEIVVVTQITTSATKVLRQNVLESQSVEARRDLAKKLDEKQSSEEETESYAYRLRALFEGEAQAKGIWGGEVKAELQVAGGSDTQRQRLADSAFSSITEQVSETTHAVEQKAMSVEQAELITTNFLEKRLFFQENPTDRTQEVRYFALREPFVVLLVLKSVKAAYTDGTKPPTVFSLAELEDRLTEILVDPERGVPLLEYLRSELQKIIDIEGRAKSIIDAAALPVLQLDRALRSNFVFRDTNQTIEVFGLIKASKDFFQPTNQTAPFDFVAGAPIGQPAPGDPAPGRAPSSNGVTIKLVSSLLAPAVDGA
jgi:hypothetical protein